MAKPCFYLVLPLFLFLGFVTPLNAGAADLELSQYQAMNLLNGVQQALIDEWLNLTASPDFDEPAKQAALFLIRNAIQKREMVFGFYELPKDYLTAIVKTAGTLLLQPETTVKTILDKLEKQSVKQAVDYALDWLLINEVKVAKGPLNYSFTSYKGNQQSPALHYIIAYKNDEAVFEFYSPEVVEPQKPTGLLLGINVASWEFDTWRLAGNKALKPFVIKVVGQVQKTELGFQWVGTKSVEISFPADVPKFVAPEESAVSKIPILGGYYQDLKDELTRIQALLRILERKTKEPMAQISAGLEKAKAVLEQGFSWLKSQVAKMSIKLFGAGVGITFEGTGEMGEMGEKGTTGGNGEIRGTENQGGPLAPLEAELLTGFTEEELRAIANDLQEKIDDTAEELDLLQAQARAQINEAIAQEADEEVPNSLGQEKGEMGEMGEKGTTGEDGEIGEGGTVDGTREKGEAEKSEITPCYKASGAVASRNKVLINEVAWMGSKKSANDEWLELKNISSVNLDLAGWQLADRTGGIRIVFSKENGFIRAANFLLLERTSDNAVPEITADLIYSGALSNTGEALYLFDEKCVLQDEVEGLPKWPAGDNTTKQTMERTGPSASSGQAWPASNASRSDAAWQTSVLAGGTPKRENSQASSSYLSAGSGSSAPSSNPAPPVTAPVAPSQGTSTQILITEIQIENGSSTNNNFIELYNPSAGAVDIGGWQIKKKSSTGAEYSVKVLSSASAIAGQAYFLWANSDYNAAGGLGANATSTQTLAGNNSVALFDKQDQLVDAVSWGSGVNQFVETTNFAQNPSVGQNLGRKWLTASENYQDTNNNQNDFELQDPTPKTQNISPAPAPLSGGNQPPVAAFVFSPTSPSVGDAVLFNGASSTDSDGQIANLLWDFGDGATATVGQATTSHIYIATGTYAVILRVIDNNQATSSPATTTITVSVPISGTPAPLPPAPLSGGGAVVINEIAWAGTKAQTSDEWLEFYNNTGADINLAGWRLATADDSPNIVLPTSTISANSFYLLERTDDTAISDVAADWFGSFGNGLSNDGEKLELRDNQNNLIDVVDFSAGWSGRGQASPNHISMERIKPNASSTADNWASNNTIAKNGKDAAGNNIYGTPKAQNSVSRAQTNITNGDFDFSQFDAITITYLGSPYIAAGITVPQNKTLSVEASTTIKFITGQGAGEGAFLNVQGKLKAIGEENKKIVFTSNGALNWQGLYFGPTSRGSEINYVKIENANRYELLVFASVKVENSDLIVRNSEITSSGNKYGLYLKNSSSTIESSIFSGFVENGAAEQWGAAAVYVLQSRAIVRGSSFIDNNYGVLFESNEGYLQNPDIVFSNNVFTRNKAPVYMSSLGFPRFSQNTFPEPYRDSYNNVFDGPVLSGASIVQDALWQSDSPFIASNSLVVAGATLNIATSTKIKFKNPIDPLATPFVRVMAGAKLDAQSSVGQPIIFTSAREVPQAGEWYGLWFEAGSQGVLKNVKIEYAGYSAWGWQKQPLRIDIGANVLQENVEVASSTNIVI